MSEVVKSEFQIMDEADSLQIQEAETAVKQALAYEVRGKKQLSYMGIKWIVLKMSQKEQPLEVIDMPVIELMKHELENKSSWIWYSTIKVRNRKTGLTTVGASESPYNIKGKYDEFGRTKSLSKAERNAFRKQIPELEINAMLDTLSPEDIQPLNISNNSNIPPTPLSKPTDQQLQILKDLGYGQIPDTKLQASNIISDLKKDAKEDEVVSDDYEKYCTCDKSIPNSITNGKTCQTCKKLMKEKK